MMVEVVNVGMLTLKVQVYLKTQVSKCFVVQNFVIRTIATY